MSFDDIIDQMEESVRGLVTEFGQRLRAIEISFGELGNKLEPLGAPESAVHRYNCLKSKINAIMTTQMVHIKRLANNSATIDSTVTDTLSDRTPYPMTNFLFHCPTEEKPLISQSLVSPHAMAYADPQFAISRGRRRHEDLTPVMPREREFYPFSTGRMTRYQKPPALTDSSIKSPPKRAVSMTRLDQLAQQGSRYSEETLKSNNSLNSGNVSDHRMTNKSNFHLPCLEVCIKNSKWLALVDSGANASIISTAMVKHLGLGPLEPSRAKHIFAMGKKAIEGNVKVELGIGSDWISVNLYVINCKCMGLLIGADILRPNRADICFSENCLIIGQNRHHFMESSEARFRFNKEFDRMIKK